MSAFNFSTFLYLSLHLVAFALLFVSVMGIPGNPDESNKKMAGLIKLWGGLLLIGWKGIPLLLPAALIAFYFQYDIFGKILSMLSLTLGFFLFLVTALYYFIQNKK
ncbi:MAG: hypothetical protein JWO58_236 [Chitinophagaceae bacterium]|nr:hypothetical protein [Chitinophagaceae bacterium]